MKTGIVSLLLLVCCSSIGRTMPATKGLLIYSAMLKTKPTKDFSIIGNKQPDSIFFSVYFEPKFSITYTTLTSKIYPADFEYGPLDQYSFNFPDSGFSLKKGILCNERFKIPFRKLSLISTRSFIKVHGILCERFFCINSFNDTTFYYLTDQFPKSAGIKISENINKCIFGFEDKQYKVFPVVVDLSIKINTTNLKKQHGKYQEIRSANKNWIESLGGEIQAAKPFPSFGATNIHKQPVTPGLFKFQKTEYSIILILKNIKSCKDYDPSLKGYYAGADRQSKDLLVALNSLALANKTKYVVVTQDYWENIKELEYPGLHIIPNAIEWEEKLNIFQQPLIVTVDRKGVVKDFISLFDLNNDKNYYDAFAELINK
jgi:hypothetical protein